MFKTKKVLSSTKYLVLIIPHNMTMYLSREVIDRHLTTLGQEMREGRADKGLEMQGSSATDHEGVTVKVARVSLYRPSTHEGIEDQVQVKKRSGPQSTETRREGSDLVASQSCGVRPRENVLGGRRVVEPHPDARGYGEHAHITFRH